MALLLPGLVIVHWGLGTAKACLTASWNCTAECAAGTTHAEWANGRGQASAGSTVLGLLTTMITPGSEGHLTTVPGLDLDLFDEAMRDAGLDVGAVTARGQSGNDRVAALVASLTP